MQPAIRKRIDCYSDYQEMVTTRRNKEKEQKHVTKVKGSRNLNTSPEPRDDKD